MDIKRGQIPLARLFVPFAIGITLAINYSNLRYSTYITALLLIILSGYNWYINKKGSEYKNRWIFGTLVALFLLSAGYSITYLNIPAQKTSDISKYADDDMHSYIVSIVSSPKEKDKSTKAVGELKGILDYGKVTKVTGKLMLSFQKEDGGDTIRYGDLLTIKTKIAPVKPPMNPDEFDYKHYLEMNGIYYEAFIPKHSFHNTDRTSVSKLLYYTDRCRHKLIDLINERIKGNEASVASAILLGYRNDLSPTVIQQFTDSGTVHVICVAGLHVGIIFWILDLLLGFLNNFKYGKVIRTCTLLILMWAYALLTGMATPVIRATVMFSFLLVGRQFSRYTNSINTLATSALFILILNPFSLADTGFQLSYLSVLGILTIYPILKRLFESKYFIPQKIWELACISASAQLSILPLSLFYFHQFPNYFILTNLLIVPLLSIAIYSGIIFLITSHIPIISVATCWLFNKCLIVMSLLVGQSNHLPAYVTKGIFLYPVEVVLILFTLLSFYFYHHSKNYKLLLTSLSALLVFFGLRIYNDRVHARQQLFAVYHVSKKSAYTFISGKQSVMPFNTIDSTDFCYHLQYHFWDRGIRDTLSIKKDTSATMLSGHLAIKNNFIEFNNQRYVFIRTNDDLPDSLSKFHVHCLVVSAAYNEGMEALQNAFTFDTLIFDSSIAPMRLKKWKKECTDLNIKYYDVSKQGAYIENS